MALLIIGILNSLVCRPRFVLSPNPPMCVCESVYLQFGGVSQFWLYMLQNNCSSDGAVEHVDVIHLHFPHASIWGQLRKKQKRVECVGPFELSLNIFSKYDSLLLTKKNIHC